MTSPNICSPCSRLNEDVLQEIFVHCAGAEPFNVHEKSNHPYPQLSVSQVCSSWRHVALLTPQLWNNIHIDDLTEAKLNTAREYLSRARSLPISIVLSDVDKIGHDLRSLLTEFLSSYRLRRLQVWARNISLILPDLPQRSVANLEELWFNSQFDGLSIELNDIRYPKLAVVEFGCNVSGCSSILRVFDCPYVKMTVIESWDFLRRCPSLETFCFVLKEDGSSPDPVSVPRILHQRLDTLQVESNGTQLMPFSIFIEALALPNLESLDMTRALRVAWSTTAFQSFAQWSNHLPNLHEFVLRNPMSYIDTGSLLASMPSIKSMHIFNYRCPSDRVHQAIFDNLTLHWLANGSLAPRLQSLEVGYISNVGRFMDMLKSRRENARMSSNGVPAPFTRVRFRGLDRNDMTGAREQIIRDPY